MLKTKKRLHDIHIKLSVNEFNALKERAEKEHLPISSAARHIIFKQLAHDYTVDAIFKRSKKK